MTDEERFLFDLQGFLIVKGVLSAAELRVLNDAVDEKFDAYAQPSEHWRPHRCSHWGQPLVDLIDHDGLMPYLPELLGPTSASTTTTASSCAAAMRAAACTAVRTCATVGATTGTVTRTA